MQKSYCPNLEEYGFCTCEKRVAYSDFDVFCLGTPLMIRDSFTLTTSAEFRTIRFFIFNQQPPEFDENKYFILPKDIFASHRVKNIELMFHIEDIIRILEETDPSDLFSQLSQIHREAFRSSRDFTESFYIENFEGRIVDFSFLVGFNQLKNLSIFNSYNIDISKLPPLPKLTILCVVDSMNGLGGLTQHSPPLIKGLEVIKLDSNWLKDKDVARILEWLLTSPSNVTLRNISLINNALTRVPNGLSNFPNLTNIQLDDFQESGLFGFLHFYATNDWNILINQSALLSDILRYPIKNSSKDLTRIGTFLTNQDDVYHLALSGVKDKSTTDFLWVQLKCKDEQIGTAKGSDSLYWATYGLQLHLRLKGGDEIHLYHQRGYFNNDLHEYWIHLIRVFSDDSNSKTKFYVQRNTPLNKTSTISFEILKLNEGGAMDIQSGIFTAPIGGIYHFSLTGIRDNSLAPLWICTELNGNKVGSAYATEETLSATYSLQATLELNKGDEIKIKLKEGIFCDSAERWGHFSGFLTRNLSDGKNADVVHFYVQKNYSISRNETVIRYRIARINKGDAMNLETGLFVAPRDGVYRFSLSGIKDGSNETLLIFLRLNKVNIGAAYASEIPWATFSLQSILLLQKGDEIDLFLHHGTCYDTNNYWTHFTGSLIG